MLFCQGHEAQNGDHDGGPQFAEVRTLRSHYKIVVIFGSITNRGSNHYPQDLHYYIITPKSL